MQTACHRCGAVIEEGTAFCPQCGAAQIRVTSPGANAPATPPLPPGTPGGMQPPAQPVMMAPAPLDWGTGFKVAALAGVIAAVPSSLPVLSIGCCIWILAAAALSVKFYQQSRPVGSVVTAGMGARLGAVTGLTSFVTFLVLGFLKAFAFGGRGEMRAGMMQALRENAARNPDPQAQQMIERLSTPAGIAFMVVFVIVCIGVAFLVFGILGGTIGSSLWGRKQTQ